MAKQDDSVEGNKTFAKIGNHNIACYFTELLLQAKGATSDRDVVSLGLFAYPVLMAADVLLYK